MSDVKVKNDPEEGRYVAEVDQQQAGFTVYRIHEGNRYFFVHTEIDDQFAGRGVGTSLVREALDDVRSKGGLVVPKCPFVRGFIEKTPAYADLVDHEIWDALAKKQDS